MAAVQHASYDDWREAYGDVHEALPGRLELACPNCGRRALRLEFVAAEDDHIGYAMFWCDLCLYSIHISRTWVPECVEFHPFGTPEDVMRKIVPEYTLVYPEPTDEDPEGFEEVQL